MTNSVTETTCCVVGGGPAGMMLGYLLARAGVPVTVLEQHNDFFRDFRGDTVHPSTLEVLFELGLLDDFLKLPHQRLEFISGVFGDFRFQGPDFRRVPARCKFVAFMPQWEFLNFLSREAKKFPAFDLRMQHEAVDLSWDGDRVTGVLARGPEQESVHLRADLVVGCDGRHSRVRQAGRLERLDFGVPIDVLWFRLSRRPGDPQELFGNVNHGKALVLIDRADYIQAGLIIPKNSYEQIKQRGLEAFRSSIVEIAPYLERRVSEIQDWEQIKVLTVQINRLRRWYRAGLLCIGDAAHAMSPAGGVGINLAIQDAVAAGNLLSRPLLQRRVTDGLLAAVQKRREFPTRVTQALQLGAHKGFSWVFTHPGPLRAPWQLKLAANIPGVHRALGYVVGIGVRPEHVRDAVHRAGRKPSWLGAALGVAAGVAAAILVLRKRREVRRQKVPATTVA
jgi:2-polyprenyl-6-methoxyphenol hydroxylase-like FAD-dependent oxidoreductase